MTQDEIDAASAALELANVRAFVDQQTEGIMERVMDKITGNESADEIHTLVFDEFMKGQAKP